MKGSNFVKSAASSAWEPLEALKSQLVNPIIKEARSELGGFVNSRRIGGAPREIGRAELERARREQKLESAQHEDEEKSKESEVQITAAISVIKEEYSSHTVKTNAEEGQMRNEFTELQVEVEQLAKSAGIDTKAHLQNGSKKIGILDIKILSFIIKTLRIKAEESKSAQELVTQRSNAKRSTGMLAWVSGKQMKIHEQGTLQLQG